LKQCLKQAFSQQGFLFCPVCGQSGTADIVQQQDELVTAKPCKHVAGVQLLAQPRGKHHQQFIALGMSGGVVDLFEIVQVQHHDGDDL